MKYPAYSIFAQTYGEGAYGSSTYQDGATGTATGTTTTGGSTTSGGALTDTGFDVLVIATIACAVIFAALIVRFWRRPTKKSTAH